jgi:3-methyladenine DNA glycosylase AlkD
MSNPYTSQLEQWFRLHANPVHAEPMKAYMRDQFQFLGIRSPERVALTKQFFKEQGVPAGEEAEEVVMKLWELPEREFQYVAMALLEKLRKQADRSQIDLLEKLIMDKPWWDTIDFIAGNLVGFHFTLYPELIPTYTDRWITSDHLWLQRTAILFQLGYKKKTDAGLLFDYIRRTADEADFFIRKAIGWALREYSKTDETAVREFVASTKLSPLSAKEALKYVSRNP